MGVGLAGRVTAEQQKIIDGFEVEIDIGPLLSAVLLGEQIDGVRRIGESAETIYQQSDTPYKLIAKANKRRLYLSLWFDDPKKIQSRVDLGSKVLELTAYDRRFVFPFNASDTSNTVVIDYRKQLGIDGTQVSYKYKARLINTTPRPYTR